MKFFFLKRDLPKSAVLAVVALAAVAGVVTGREKPAIEVVESKPARVERTSDPLAAIDLSKLNRGESIAPQSDPFAQRSFAPEQAAAPQGEATAAAAPSAPPLPFRYFGKLIENGRLEVFVMRGDEVLSIAKGQKIDAEYRVDSITDTSISFTYLPLKMRQTMDLPEGQG
jgi:hypothetical protein